MLKDKTIIIFDLDGTAIDSPTQKLPSGRLTQATKNLLKNRRLCAATGRPWLYARPVLDELGLTEPCIIASGTQIRNPLNGDILWQSTLDAITVQRVVETLKGHQGLRAHPSCKVLLNDYTEHDHFYGGMKVQNLTVGEPAYILTLVFVPDAIAGDVLRHLSTVPDISCTMVVAQAPGHKDIHITSPDATKEHATAKVLEMLGLTPHSAIGIGDGHNDLHLFRAVTHRVAMGNAVDELKEMAHEILDPVHQDGLALFFERLLVADSSVAVVN